MIITRLRGGLGNQMFQYAVGRVLSLKNNAPLVLDIFSLGRRTGAGNTIREYELDVFQTVGKIAVKSEVPFAYRMRGRILPRIYRKFLARPFARIFKTEKHVFVEKSFSFDQNVLEASGNTYLSGYWQSYLYFAGYEDVIRNDFRLKNPVSDITKKLAAEISTQNSVCLHVRRGDYVGNAFHETVTNDYYTKALGALQKKLSEQTGYSTSVQAPAERSARVDSLYVFSDDIEWCRAYLVFPGIKTMYVGDEYAGAKNREHLFLMIQCRHFIIANSSFSWWAAWLSTQSLQTTGVEKIVIAPKRWFADGSIDTSKLTPPDWIRM